MPSFPRSVVGRILESDILDGCVGYKYPTTACCIFDPIGQKYSCYDTRYLKTRHKKTK